MAEGQYRYHFMQISSKGSPTAEPIPITAERPRLLKKMAEVLSGSSLPLERLAADADGLPPRC
jgi:hypothetical protein